MQISNKKAVECAETLVAFCKQQTFCQNCIFREFGADSWNCQLKIFDLKEVLANIEAKKETEGICNADGIRIE